MPRTTSSVSIPLSYAVPSATKKCAVTLLFARSSPTRAIARSSLAINGTVLDAAEQKLRAEEEQERELEKLANALGSKPLVKDKPKPKKKKPAPPPRAKENNGAKDGATASETKKGKGGATGAKDAAAASKTKKGKKGAK